MSKGLFVLLAQRPARVTKGEKRAKIAEECVFLLGTTFIFGGIMSASVITLLDAVCPSRCVQ